MLLHFAEKGHVFLGGDIPAEILAHTGFLQSLEIFGGIVVQVDGTGEGTVEIVGIVAFEGKAQTATTLIVCTGNGILKTAGGMNYRHGTVPHGVHLTEAARLALGGHHIDVTAGIDPGHRRSEI